MIKHKKRFWRGLLVTMYCAKCASWCGGAAHDPITVGAEEAGWSLSFPAPLGEALCQNGWWS